jgi:arylsulfatase A-like enzyme
VPAALFVLWVPSSWIADHWRAFRIGRRALTVVVLAALVVIVVAASATLDALARRQRDGRMKARELGTLAVAAALVAAACYWADATLYEGDYEDFHYGVSMAFVVFTALAVVAARPLLAKAARARWPTASPWVSRVGLVLLVVAPVAVSLAPIGAFGRADALVFRKLLGTARALTDMDGDGYSSVFGGGDCAAFDPDFSPERQEIPQNGLDEDCTGKDAKWPAPPPPAGGNAPRKRYNVVFISIDALRADRLGLYGHSRPTSPTLDRLGERSLVFENAYSQASKTGESVPSFMTGTYPSNLPRDYESLRHRRKWAYRLGDAAVPLAVLLKRQGYATGAGVGLRVLKEMGMDRGFDAFRADKPEAATREFLDKARAPFFLWAHFKQPHAPYDRNPKHDFGDEPIDRYDGEVAAADDSVKAVLSQLRRRGLTDSTIVIVTADHGEEFGEHGGRFHTRKLYRELLHVPLIVKIPGIEPRRISEPVELVDIVPTLADVLGFELPPGAQDGQSLLAGPRSRAVGGAYSEDVNVKEQRLMGRSLYDGRYRLIDDLRRGRRELYDEEKDPGEQHDVSAGRPDVVAVLWEAMSVRALRRHTRTFEALTPAAELETWAALLPTIERDEMLALALERFPRGESPTRKAILKTVLQRPLLDREIASRAKALLGPH